MGLVISEIPNSHNLNGPHTPTWMSGYMQKSAEIGHVRCKKRSHAQVSDPPVAWRRRHVSPGLLGGGWGGGRIIVGISQPRAPNPHPAPSHPKLAWLKDVTCRIRIPRYTRHLIGSKPNFQCSCLVNWRLGTPREPPHPTAPGGLVAGDYFRISEARIS